MTNDVAVGDGAGDVDGQPEDDPIEAVLEEIQRGEGDDPRPGVREFLSVFRQFGQPNPLAKKLTGDHVTEMLAIQKAGQEHHFEDRKDQRGHWRLLAGGLGVFVLALVGLLAWTGNEEAIVPTLGAVATIVGVAFGGWGIGRNAED